MRPDGLRRLDRRHAPGVPGLPSVHPRSAPNVRGRSRLIHDSTAPNPLDPKHPRPAQCQAQCQRPLRTQLQGGPAKPIPPPWESQPPRQTARLSHHLRPRGPSPAPPPAASAAHRSSLAEPTHVQAQPAMHRRRLTQLPRCRQLMRCRLLAQSWSQVPRSCTVAIGSPHADAPSFHAPIRRRPRPDQFSTAPVRLCPPAGAHRAGHRRAPRHTTAPPTPHPQPTRAPHARHPHATRTSRRLHRSRRLRRPRTRTRRCNRRRCLGVHQEHYRSRRPPTVSVRSFADLLRGFSPRSTSPASTCPRGVSVATPSTLNARNACLTGRSSSE